MILLKLFFSFFIIGSFSFGGGYAMIPLIQKEIVETRGWIGMEEFTDLIAVSQATPGPVSVNAATFIGFRVGGLSGAAAATGGVLVTPIAVVALLFWLARKHKDSAVVRGALKAIKPALVALIAYSAYSIGLVSFTSWIPAVLAGISFLILLIKPIHPIYLILPAALFGVFFL